MKQVMRFVGMAAFLLFSGATAFAQNPVPKPKVQTSARPEQTTVYAPGKEGNRMKDTAQPAAKTNKKTKTSKTAKTAPTAKSKPAKVKADSGSRYHALKTNIAYDAVGVLNLAYEVQVHRRMTVDIPVMWSLWDAQRDHALRIAALQPELRWWMGQETGRGHFFGLHAHVAWYNLKWDDNRYQDNGRPLLGAGLSYGYKLPLGQHWGAEFTAGFGYANTRYNTYYNIENGALLNTRTRHYWGLTRLGASLVYRF